MLNHLKEFFISLGSSEWQWNMVFIDMAIIIGLIFIFKKTIGLYSGINVKEELAEKDNPAYGFVFAASFLSFFIIMAAASTGNFIVSFWQEVSLVLGYAFAGMLMLLASKIIFDKVSLSQFCVRDELSKRNMAVAIVDGGNLIATSIIVFAYMSWVKSTSFDAICVIAYGWLLSQIVLSGFTHVRGLLFKSDSNQNLSEAIQSNNVAVAIRFTGYRIALAMAPLITISHYPYESEWKFMLATEIFLTTILLATIYLIGTAIAKKIIFNKVNFGKEINDQKNTGMAYVELAIVIGLTILNYGLIK